MCALDLNLFIVISGRPWSAWFERSSWSTRSGWIPWTSWTEGWHSYHNFSTKNHCKIINFCWVHVLVFEDSIVHLNQEYKCQQKYLQPVNMYINDLNLQIHKNAIISKTKNFMSTMSTKINSSIMICKQKNPLMLWQIQAYIRAMYNDAVIIKPIISKLSCKD